MRRPLAIAMFLLVGWSSRTHAAECPPLPPEMPDYDLMADKLLDDRAVTIIDAVVERPANNDQGGGEILRATKIWKGPQVTHFSINTQVFDALKPDCRARFYKVGQKVRAILFMTERGYETYIETQQLATLDLIEALARRLNQSEEPRP